MDSIGQHGWTWLCHPHGFGRAAPSDCGSPARQFASTRCHRKAGRWEAVKSSYLRVVLGSSPAGEQVRQLLDRAGRASGVRGVGKWPFSKTKLQSLHPAPCLGQSTAVCLLLCEIPFFFWRKRCVLKEVTSPLPLGPLWWWELFSDAVQENRNSKRFITSKWWKATENVQKFQDLQVFVQSDAADILVCYTVFVLSQKRNCSTNSPCEFNSSEISLLWL